MTITRSIPPGAGTGNFAAGEYHGNFSGFFEEWIIDQEKNLRELRSAAGAGVGDAELRALVNRVIGHYEYYYAAKSAAAHADVLPMFTPSWTSTTENLFLWVGGWRPTAAIHLLYSKSGLQLESQLPAVIAGEITSDLAGVSAEQLLRIDELHRRTVQREKEISEEEAVAQEAIADGQMVELSEKLSKIGNDVDGGEDLEKMESAIAKKSAGIECVLKKADELRLETLKGVVEILNPMQAVHYLIAAAELHLRVHDLGKKKDIVSHGALASESS